MAQFKSSLNKTNFSTCYVDLNPTPYLIIPVNARKLKKLENNSAALLKSDSAPSQSPPSAAWMTKEPTQTTSSINIRNCN